MVSDAGEHIGKPCLRIDVIHFGGHDQAVHHRRPVKEPKRRGANALFPNAYRGTLGADSVQSLLAKHARVASERCRSLASKRVSPHVLRRSAAMELLQAGVDCSVIALWLGHDSIETTQTYLHAHLALKEAALTKLKPYARGKPTRFQAERPPTRLPRGPVGGQTMPNGSATNLRSTAHNCADRAIPSKTVRHSPTGGINLRMPHAA
jgi:hypothetical protein